MVMECWAIIAVLVMILYMYFVRGKIQTVGAVSPLLLLPFFHLFGGPLSRYIVAQWFPQLPIGLVQIAFDILAVVIAACTFGAISRAIKTTKMRNFYLLMCMGFTVLLAWVFIYNTIFPPVVGY